MEAAGGGRSPPRLVADRVYAAAGGDVQKGRSTLSRALQNLGGRFRILRAQQPPEDDDDDDRDPRDPSLNQSHDFGIRTPQELARQNMNGARCWTSTFTFVSVEKRYIEMQDIGKGIPQLIEQHAIEKLITGAATDKRYFVGMAQLKSTSSIFVNQQADPSCYIWFICKRQLIYVR
ncbi:U-box domain-containing protein 37-like [Syzygium oleosum]|uniref:U-box domain-containing protein 37-like n=1 Tax=Syzygium oleosum TaxID=219896 RepID=UPI0011D1D438|nr:U-box domain-containing protein 37-like [Syzygium oleosum]